jgi:hypothetical protein
MQRQDQEYYQTCKQNALREERKLLRNFGMGVAVMRAVHECYLKKEK